jgi:putative transposase
MLKKKHSRVEIAQKLAEASDLASRGKLQSEIAQTLGISVMTLHRWRKIPRDTTSAEAAEVDQFEQELSEDSRLEELRLENSRLRRLVTDLLLERMKLEEAARANRPSTRRGAQQFRRRDLIASYS